MKIKSIRSKTTLLYSGILLVILVVYNIIFFFSVRSILVKDIDEQLRVKAGEIVNVLRTYENITDTAPHPLNFLEELLRKQGGLPSKAVVIDNLWHLEFETLKLKEDYINILTIKGKPLIHSLNMTEEIDGLISKQFGFSAEKIYFGNIHNESSNLRVINMPFIYKNDFPLTIQVATPFDSVYLFLAKLMLISSVCIISLISLTSFLGSFFVRRILGPVTAVTKVANNISHMDLGTRIPSQEADIEMKQLIDSFNGMIERLEKSFMHINEFNSYVAHELKTPLAIVKGELELAIDQAEEKNEDGKILSDCLEEIDRMIRITKDLLLLAKIDYKPQILKIKRVDFKKFFGEIIEYGAMLCAQKKIVLTSELPKEDLFVQGDTVHLHRLFLNIISNAIRHTPENGKIHLSLSREEDYARVDISDTGEGISEESMKKIFNKFFRVDKDEKALDTGSGLGLSIALSIAKAHQGNITVESKINEGTTFFVILPLSA